MEIAIKKLCFGVLSTVIHKCGKNLTGADTVDKLTKTIDPDSRYVEEDVEHSPAISRLMNCKGNFPSKLTKKGSGANEDKDIRKNALTNIVQLAKVVKKKDVVRNFNNTVINNIDDDKKEQTILVLLDVIKNDTEIDNKKMFFKNCFGVEKDVLLKKDQYKLSNFLASILLYTVDVNNNYGKDGNIYVKWITQENINKIASCYNNEFCWDSDSQTLKRIKKENTLPDDNNDRATYQAEPLTTQTDIKASDWNLSREENNRNEICETNPLDESKADIAGYNPDAPFESFLNLQSSSVQEQVRKFIYKRGKNNR